MEFAIRIQLAQLFVEQIQSALLGGELGCEAHQLVAALGLGLVHGQIRLSQQFRQVRRIFQGGESEAQTDRIAPLAQQGAVVVGAL
ncbi:hypothetical protein Q3H58_003601 [Pseudomonas psychrotolerans]|nr:hypothetical protein [Pseudomonas psychrotolerans]